MYKDVLRSIEGIGIYPVISFVIFFAFFIVVFMYIMTVNKEMVSKMSNLPLGEGSDKTSTQKTNNHEFE